MKWDDSEMGSHHACTVIFRVRVPVAPPNKIFPDRAPTVARKRPASGARSEKQIRGPIV